MYMLLGTRLYCLVTCTEILVTLIINCYGSTFVCIT